MKIHQPLAMNEIGKRANQEDSIFPSLGNATSDNRLFIVCDGMGGHESGEIASNSVCKSISEYLKDINPDTFSSTNLQDSIIYAYNQLDKLDSNPESQRKMGTTLTFLYLGNKQVFVGHIGDSRVYHLRRDENGKMNIVHVTEDHSTINLLIKGEFITKEEAKTHPRKNEITQAIQPNVKRFKATEYITSDVKDDDYFFLCSDGVLETFDEDSKLIDIFGKDCSDEEKLNSIKSLCKESSKDNNSAYLIHIKEGINIPKTEDKQPQTAPQENSPTQQQKKIQTKRIIVQPQNVNPVSTGGETKKYSFRNIGGIIIGCLIILGTCYWLYSKFNTNDNGGNSLPNKETTSTTEKYSKPTIDETQEIKEKKISDSIENIQEEICKLYESTLKSLENKSSRLEKLNKETSNDKNKEQINQLKEVLDNTKKGLNELDLDKEKSEDTEETNFI